MQMALKEIKIVVVRERWYVNSINYGFMEDQHGRLIEGCIYLGVNCIDIGFMAGQKMVIFR